MMEADDPAGVSVAVLLADAAADPRLDLELLAGGEGVERRITIPHAQKTGLALSGHDQFLREGRVLILGESEVRYINGLDPADRTAAARRVTSHSLPCIVVTEGFDTAPELAIEAERAAMPLLRTRASTADAMAWLAAILDTRLAPRGTIHGVLLDILGLGVLVIGESGIGKSECALDLVVRGHRLVADDAVDLRCRSGAFILGSCPEATRHHIEIRGLGLLNIQDLFGVASTRPSKRVELVVQLERWEHGFEYDRLGVDEMTYELLGVRIPLIRMPVAPGRNLAMLVEVAARNQLARAGGRNGARALVERLDARLRGVESEDARLRGLGGEDARLRGVGREDARLRGPRPESEE